MQVLKTFRHEYKYHLKREEMYKIRDKLSEVMEVDRDKNGYMVRSLYFDSINNIDYYEKLDGDPYRKKIRMRIYQDNPEIIKLEIKKKMDGHQLKESLIINKKIAKEIINRNYSSLLEIGSNVALEIYDIMMSNVYIPRCIIEYERMAFIGNTSTRITLDYNIRKSNDIDRFLEGDINYYECTNKNEVLLEVKFDRFLEGYIDNILREYTYNNESFSKYIIGRNVI